MADSVGYRLWLLRGLAAIVVLAILATTSHAAPLKLLTIEFHGAERLSNSLLLEAATTASPIPRTFENNSALLLGIEKIETAVTARYFSEGYYHARIDSFSLRLQVPEDSAKGVVLALFLQEGARYTVRNISLSGANEFRNADLLARFQTKLGEPLDEQVLEQDIHAVLRLYEEHGFPFAKLDVRSIAPIDLDKSTGALDIALALEEGKRAKIGRIAVTGNRTTNSKVILRELRLTPGSYYDALEVDRARSRVERLGFFESVTEPELFLIDDSTVALLLHVKEASTSTIDGVLGYNPAPSASQSAYLSGFVDLGFRNISGTGRNGSLNYDHENPSSQQLEVKYLEPWLFNYPLNLGVNFIQRQQDSTYVRTSYGAELSLLFTEDISIDGSIAIDRIVPTELPGMAFTVFDSRTITTGLGASLDTRDNAIAPHYGILASLSALLGEKSIFGPAQFLDAGTSSSVTLKTIGIDAAIFIPTINERFIAAVGVHARNVSSTGDTLDASDLLRLGGLRTIRGYSEGNFLVSRYAYTNLEYRVMTGRYSFLFLFSDIGYLVRDMLKGDPTEQRLSPLSYGLGAQVESPLGILTVSIGIAKGEPLDEAKLSFGVVKQF